VAAPYASLRVHLLWGTRGGRPWLDPEWRGRLFACASSALEGRGARLLCAGAARDHLHLYVEVPATRSVSDLVQATKSHTRRWIRRSFPHRSAFAWQAGYAAFSVTPRDDERVMDYIRHQDTGHRERTFTTEYATLLEQHGLAYDLGRMLE